MKIVVVFMLDIKGFGDSKVDFVKSQIGVWFVDCIVFEVFCYVFVKEKIMESMMQERDCWVQYRFYCIECMLILYCIVYFKKVFVLFVDVRFGFLSIFVNYFDGLILGF